MNTQILFLYSGRFICSVLFCKCIYSGFCLYQQSIQDKPSYAREFPSVQHQPHCVVMLGYLKTFIQDWQEMNIDPHQGVMRLRWQSHFHQFIHFLEIEKLKDSLPIMNLEVTASESSLLQITVESYCD